MLKEKSLEDAKENLRRYGKIIGISYLEEKLATMHTIEEVHKAAFVLYELRIYAS